MVWNVSSEIAVFLEKMVGNSSKKNQTENGLSVQTFLSVQNFYVKLFIYISCCMLRNFYLK